MMTERLLSFLYMVTLWRGHDGLCEISRVFTHELTINPWLATYEKNRQFFAEKSDGYTLENFQLEPENHLFEKDQHLPNLYFGIFLGSIKIFRA